MVYLEEGKVPVATGTHSFMYFEGSKRSYNEDSVFLELVILPSGLMSKYSLLKNMDRPPNPEGVSAYRRTRVPACFWYVEPRSWRVAWRRPCCRA